MATLTYYLNKIAKKEKVGIDKIRQRIAKKLNRSMITIYMWESGRKMPRVGSLHELHKILKSYGYDINIVDLFWKGNKQDELRKKTDTMREDFKSI